MFRKFGNDCVERADRSKNIDAQCGLLRLANFWFVRADLEDKRARVQKAARFAGHIAQAPKFSADRAS